MTFIPLTTQNSLAGNYNAINIAMRDIETTIRPLSTPSKNWIAPTLQNGWVNYGAPWETAGYRKDALGYVHLKGLVKSGTVGSTTAIFTLPVGFRPKSGKALLFASSSNDAYARINIFNDTGNEGKVCCGVGNNAWVSLDGITFLAEG